MLLHEDSRQERYLNALTFAEGQVRAEFERNPDFFPVYTVQGRWKHEGERWTDWTGGFFPGLMWNFHKRTSDAQWRQPAEALAKRLEFRRFDVSIPNQGFIFLNSHGPWFEATRDPALFNVLVDAAHTLAKRFIPSAKYLHSVVGPGSMFIDMMMNVPLLYRVAQVTGETDLKQVADAHVNTARTRLVRSDGSTVHEGVFDPQTGAFLNEGTQQGLRSNSTWARGLAWSMYGFSQVYQITGDPACLAVAEKNAGYWLEHLPIDRIPYWDFDADLSQPLPYGPQKDSSAAAIGASALLDLAKQTSSFEKAIAYRTAALTVLDTLVGPEYLATERPGWEGILQHGVYHAKRNLGVDESTMWGDFYFVEALTKAVALNPSSSIASNVK